MNKGYGVVCGNGIEIGYSRHPERRWPFFLIGLVAVAAMMAGIMFFGCGASSTLEEYQIVHGRSMYIFPSGEGWFSYPDPNKVEGIIKRIFHCPADSGQYCITVNLPDDGIPIVFWQGVAYVEMRLDGKLITWGNTGRLEWPVEQE